MKFFHCRQFKEAILRNLILKLASLSIVLLGVGCLPKESGVAVVEKTDCEKAREVASGSSNGATLTFCDGFNQSTGKLSTVSPNWMDVN